MIPAMFVKQELTWWLAADAMPDDDATVLLGFDAEADNDVEMGWHDSDGWHFAESGGEPPLAPKWWCHVPEAPK